MRKSSSNTSSSSLILEKLPGYFLILCLVVSLGFMFYVLRPFLTVVFVAGVLTITFNPIYQKVLKWFRGWERSASLVTCLFVILVTVIPITIFIILLTDEGVSAYQNIQTKIESGVFDKYLQWGDGGYFFELKEKLSSIIDLDQLNIKENIIKVAQGLSTFLVSQTANFLKSLSNFVLNIFVMFFAMFYFFKDGKKIVKKIGEISPLPAKHESQLFEKVDDMVKAIVVGVFLTAIAQGVVGGIGFTIAGISSPMFWGTAIALFSLVPVVGTAIIWVPAAIILAVLGSYGSALFLVIWGFLAIGSVDNLLRPYLIGGKANTYPLFTFLVILGGIWTMGFKGIIVGPLVLMILMSFLHIYSSEYAKILKN